MAEVGAAHRHGDCTTHALGCEDEARAVWTACTARVVWVARSSFGNLLTTAVHYISCYRLPITKMEEDLHVRRRRNWPTEWERFIESSQAYNIEQIYVPRREFPAFGYTGDSDQLRKLVHPSSEPKWREHVGIHATNNVITFAGHKYRGWKGDLLVTAGLYLRRNDLEMDCNLLYPKDYSHEAKASVNDVCTIQATDTFFVVHRTAMYLKINPDGGGGTVGGCVWRGVALEMQSFNVGDTLYYNHSLFTYPTVLDDKEKIAREFRVFNPDSVDVIIMVPKGTWYIIGKDVEVILPPAKLEVVKIDNEARIVFATLTETVKILDFEPIFESLDVSEQERFIALGKDKEWGYVTECRKSYLPAFKIVNNVVVEFDSSTIKWSPTIRSLYMKMSKEAVPGDVLKLNGEFAMIQAEHCSPPAGDFNDIGLVWCEVRVPDDVDPILRRRSWNDKLDVEVWPTGTFVQLVACSGSETTSSSDAKTHFTILCI